MTEVTACGLCGGTGLDVVLDLGQQPLAEAMTSHGALHPLRAAQCPSCGLVQLTCQVSQRDMFQPAHPYATGNTASLREHFRELAVTECLPRLARGEMVVDIGANDGTFLSYFALHPVRTVAVEPTDQVDKSSAQVFKEFFTARLARSIRMNHGSAKIVTATNVLAHVPDPHDFMEGVRVLLADDGVFITENHDWASVANGLQVDTVYHEHLRYYTVGTLARLLEKHGLFVTSTTQIPTHGGSFRTIAVPSVGDLRVRASLASVRLGQLVRDCAARGPVYGVGAATRATPLLHFAGLAPYLDCVCEVTGSDKIGHLMPGTDIPVVNESRLLADQPPYALIFAWHLADTIMPLLRKRGFKGKFLIPLPEPRMVD